MDTVLTSGTELDGIRRGDGVFLPAGWTDGCYGTADAATGETSF
jgi:hypothetical protein